MRIQNSVAYVRESRSSTCFCSTSQKLESSKLKQCPVFQWILSLSEIPRWLGENLFNFCYLTMGMLPCWRINLYTSCSRSFVEYMLSRILGSLLHYYWVKISFSWTITCIAIASTNLYHGLKSRRSLGQARYGNC